MSWKGQISKEYVSNNYEQLCMIFASLHVCFCLSILFILIATTRSRVFPPVLWPWGWVGSWWAHPPRGGGVEWAPHRRPCHALGDRRFPSCHRVWGWASWGLDRVFWWFISDWDTFSWTKERDARSFAGFNQQDAQEFLRFTLDNLHEVRFCSHLFFDVMALEDMVLKNNSGCDVSFRLEVPWCF